MARRETYRAGRRRLNRIPRRWARFRRVVGSLLVVVGSAMAVAHLIAHLASMRVVGALDMVIGFPMAAILVLVGLLLIGLQSVPPRASRYPTDS